MTKLSDTVDGILRMASLLRTAPINEIERDRDEIISLIAHLGAVVFTLAAQLEAMEKRVDLMVERVWGLSGSNGSHRG